MSYVELHAHSAFSFLDGASSPQELVDAAATQGHTHLALTDHDGLCGSLEFAHAARDAGVVPITGAELTLDDGTHITLIARTGSGYRNLCRLVTRAHAHTRDSRDRRATDPALPAATLEAHADGLICLTGCLQRGHVSAPLRGGDPGEARARLSRLRGWFGPGGVYVEIQNPLTRGGRAHARALASLGDVARVPVVATGNVHAHHPRRALLQDAFVAIRHRLTLDASEGVRRGNRTAVLRSPADTAAAFRDFPGAVGATRAIAERVEFDLTRDLGYAYPDFASGRPGETSSAALARICAYELGARYPNARKRADARRRLDHELALIDHHGLAGFFLLHREILELAREVALEVRPAGSARRWLPPGRGRGSSVGSIVCYLTGLSHIDPVANGLFLGRFLNRDMASVPDIDLDFPRDVRERLIAEIIARYGNEHAALVAAFPTFRTRMAIRELGGALALPEGDIERLARMADGWSRPSELADDLRRLPDAEQKLGSSRWRALAFLAAEAAGLPRHLSQHSGGMVISAQPLVELVPVVPAAFPGRQMCQWNKDSCADAGFVKIDLLGLGMLSAVEECVDLIARCRGERIDLSRIDFTDTSVYREIQNADTVGTFQIESRAQMQSLLQTRPENLDDLTIQVALIRPGPVSGGAVHPYVKHRRARRANPGFEPPYDHPLLAPVLRETLGVVVFQEQVLEVAMALAGFTAGQAEGLRRAMSRTRSREAMLRMWGEFRDGARARGVDDDVIRTVFTKLVGFSNFGFPKAHSAAFAVLAYQSAWLRRYHPAEFLAALLNAQPMGFYPPASLIRDAQRRGVTVVGPCVNRGEAHCIIEPVAAPVRLATTPRGWRVRVGLGYVREVRADAAARLVGERYANGPFRDLADLAARCDLRREQLAQLIRSGACDAFGEPRRRMAWHLSSLTRPQATGTGRALQLALPLPVPDAPDLAEPDRFERVVNDYETMGLSAGWHLMALTRPHLPSEAVSAAALRDLRDGATVTVAGMVTARQRPATAGGIVFMLLEDETGLINVVVHPPVYEAHRALLRAEPLVIVRGRLQHRERTINVIAASVAPCPVAPERTSEADDAARVRAAVPPGQHFGRGRR
ncbi:MAG: error-prone DNA polymerase [Thermoleophilia bacterium]|nr:error-prone DNA polymerase [Thermoleophilia bacterium]